MTIIYASKLVARIFADLVPVAKYSSFAARMPFQYTRCIVHLSLSAGMMPSTGNELSKPHTFPSTKIQQTSSLSCFSSSSLVNCFCGVPADCFTSAIKSSVDGFIHPPSPVSGSVRCLNHIPGTPFSLVSITSGRTTYQYLFIIPIVFQLGRSGWVVLKTFQHPTLMLLHPSKYDVSELMCHGIHVQDLLPWRIGSSGNLRIQ